MYIADFIWLPDIIEELAVNHNVTQDEVEDVFFNNARYRFLEKEYRQGENVYSAAGQTNAGRYLIIFFIHKPDNTALLLSAIWIKPNESAMSESNNDISQTSISQAQTLEEIAEFWDTHSPDAYWDQTHEVEFELRIKRRHRITLDPDVYTQIETQARTRGIQPETLVNLWLVERLQATR